MNTHQETQWSLVAKLLRRAGDELECSSTMRGATTEAEIPESGPAQFAMFLENNELGLAWDKLALLAEERGASGTFWQNLLLAAGLMSSAGQAHLAATRLCEDEHRAARAS